MTQARLAKVEVDLSLARRYLATAERMLEDATATGISIESRYTLLYDAARNAVTAVLRADGKRVTSGAGAHVVTFRTVRRLLGAEHAAALDRIDHVRKVRHQIEYDTREVSEWELEQIDGPTRAVVAAARAFVDAAGAGELS